MRVRSRFSIEWWWNDIMKVLRDNAMERYRVEIARFRIRIVSKWFQRFAQLNNDKVPWAEDKERQEAIKQVENLYRNLLVPRVSHFLPVSPRWRRIPFTLTELFFSVREITGRSSSLVGPSAALRATTLRRSAWAVLKACARPRVFSSSALHNCRKTRGGSEGCPREFGGAQD